MKPYTKRILVLISGWTFILLGIVGLFLPILQGVLFLLVGLIILSSEYVWAHRLLTRLRERFPKLGRTADQATARATAWLRRISGQGKTD
ncbi:MAG: PGPGW domain-containing protein [Terriglobales bacterium]